MYNACVTHVRSIVWIFCVLGAVVFALWHPQYRSGSQNDDCIHFLYELGECLAISFSIDITGTGTVPS